MTCHESSGGVCCSRRRCGAEPKSSQSLEISGGTRRRHADFSALAALQSPLGKPATVPDCFASARSTTAQCPRLLFTLPIYMNCASVSLFFQGQLSAFSPQRALGRRSKIYLKGSFVLRAFCASRWSKSPPPIFLFLCVCVYVHILQSQKTSRLQAD